MWISLAVAIVLAISLALTAFVLVRKNGTLSSQKRELSSKNQALVSQNQAFVGINAAAKRRAATSQATARTAVAKARAKANSAVAGERAKLKARSAALDARATSLDSRESAVTHQENVQAASTFSDGVYLVGTDIPAGSYVAAGGEGCYWERGDGNGGIVDNYFSDGGGQVRATINTGEEFTSNGCGTWSPG